ncbi:MAG: rhodanese-like domain-containing protein [Deltaproteobacteria bacterium]|nr:MAG: rhodanese-like domain-containing protein [Deltaproteobacteria bacterium]
MNSILTLRRTVVGLALVGVASLTAAGCSESTPASAAPTASTASPSAAAPASKVAPLPDRDPALAKRLVEEEHAVILDVRTPGEFSTGAIPGAVNIPVQELGRRMDEVSKLVGADKGHAIVVYCRSGRRSGIAKEMLQEAGYQRVTNLGPKENWR